jgi:diaminopimelate decarboxylase
MIDAIGYRAGVLSVEGRNVEDLAVTFGTPLYITSEAMIRHNFRELHRAFASRHDDVTILYANKANNNLAVRHILTSEGAGGDCFGLGELSFALDCGVPAEKVALNGANKALPEIQLAIGSGVTINVDHITELAKVAQAAQESGNIAFVNLRILPFSFADLTELSGDLAFIARDTSHDKWGMDRSALIEAVAFALSSSHLKLRGLHMHVSRITATAAPFALASQLLAQCAADLSETFGWTPEVLDIGGGYAHSRDPEGGAEAGSHIVASADEYAEAVVTTLRREFAAKGLRLPKLWLEPGRYLVSNSTILVTRVGLVKPARDDGLSWVYVDASTNHCLRAPLQNYHYQISNVRDRQDSATMLANVTGPTCTMDLIAEHRLMQTVEAGDLMAVWDVGGYAEVMATQFNLIPRPPTVLVSGDRADIIRRREEHSDLMRTQRLPERFQSALHRSPIDGSPGSESTRQGHEGGGI